jgi:hypothetical protein
MFVWAQAGTYTVGVQYEVSVNTATLTVQNRHLWVWTRNFT